MLTLVFVFMLFNLTIIWNLPTISIGGRGRDSALSLIGPGDWFFVHGLARKAAPQGIPRWRRPPTIPCHVVPVSSVKVVCLLNQIALPLSYMCLNLACIVQRLLHGGAILGRGASTRCCRRVIPSSHDGAIPNCGIEDTGPNPVAVRASHL